MTPNGASFITYPMIFRMISLSDSTNFLTGSALSLPTATMAMPKAMDSRTI